MICVCLLAYSTMDNCSEFFHLLVIPHLSSDCLASIAGELKKQSSVKRADGSDHSPTPLGRRLTCPAPVIQAIYASCRYLELGFDVHHLAIELFELFMIRQVKYMGERKRADNMSSIEVIANQRQMREQVWLRLLTCVLLAAKYQSNLHEQILPMRDKILNILKRININMGSKTLKRSELRVLARLEFKVQKPMLLSSARVVVSSLVHNVPSLTNESQFLTCIGLLCNLTSLKRRLLPLSAFRKDKKVTSHEDRLLRLTSAIIATAASVSLESHLSRKVTEELSFITHLPMEEISLVRDSFRSLIARKT